MPRLVPRLPSPALRAALPPGSNFTTCAVGIEQFRPLPGSSPALGEVGQCQRVPAVIVQFHLPPDQARLQRIIEHGIAPHHPWRSPVIEVSAVWLWLDPPGPAAPAQSTPA